MDEDSSKTEDLAAGNYDLLIMNASPTSISGLKEAGVAHTDLFIAVTPEETKNITCCMLAHTLGAKQASLPARCRSAYYYRCNASTSILRPSAWHSR